MNLPAYRHALENAIREHADTVEKARAVLQERIHLANQEFFRDEAELKAVEPEYGRPSSQRDR